MFYLHSMMFRNPTMFEMLVIGETGVGWGKFWLGQCPSVPNEFPDGETNYVLDIR